MSTLVTVGGSCLLLALLSVSINFAIHMWRERAYGFAVAMTLAIFGTVCLGIALVFA